MLNDVGYAAKRILLASGSFTSVASLSFILSTLDPVQSSDNTYEIVFRGYQPATDDKKPIATFSSDAGATYASTGYYYAANGSDTTGNTSQLSAANSSSAYFCGEVAAGAGLSNVANETAISTINLIGVNTGSSLFPTMKFDNTYWEASGRYSWQKGSATNTNSADYDAIKFTWESGGNYAAVGTYAIYKTG